MKKYPEEMIEYFSVVWNNHKTKTTAGDRVFKMRKVLKCWMKKWNKSLTMMENEFLMQMCKSGYSNWNCISENESQRTAQRW